MSCICGHNSGMSIRSLVSISICSHSFLALTALKSFLVLCFLRFFFNNPSSFHIFRMALVRYASPSIYTNSYPLLTHIFLQSLNSFIPFLPNNNILTRRVRCMFHFPKFLQKAVDSYNDALYNSRFAFIQESGEFIVIKSFP